MGQEIYVLSQMRSTRQQGERPFARIGMKRLVFQAFRAAIWHCNMRYTNV
jgi:hypothetical protein